MQNPPFRVARPAGSLFGLQDAAADPLLAPAGTPAGAGPSPTRSAPAARPGSSPVTTTAEAHAGPSPDEAGRARFGSMDPHLHCSVIGTCLSTTELRKAMRHFIVVDGASGLDVHHEAVRLAQRNDIAHALNKLLDRKHDAVVRRFGRARDPGTLAALWQDAVKSGEVPGAYWAVLTHRRTTPDLRQQVFGDVHMLSHLVGAANRADLQRLVAIEHENDELQQRNQRQQDRIEALAQERDQGLADCRRLRLRVEDLEMARDRDDSLSRADDDTDRDALAAIIATQTQRRESAESRIQSLETEVSRLTREMERAREHALVLGRELAAAEAELRRPPPLAGDDDASPYAALAGRRLLYVGGRPSSSAAIRDFVSRHRVEYQRHDGGIEDRKGLLAPAIAWADLVVFPVDCIDHDSALQLKRQCVRQGTTWLALRSASVASLAAALASLVETPAAGPTPAGGDLTRHD